MTPVNTYDHQLASAGINSFDVLADRSSDGHSEDMNSFAVLAALRADGHPEGMDTSSSTTTGTDSGGYNFASRARR